MITITIRPVQDYDSARTEGGHVIAPTFIQFLQALSYSIENGHEQLYVYDDEGQFATMPRWAMAEKIGELTSYQSALAGKDIILF